jgi:hypothetical protein
MSRMQSGMQRPKIASQSRPITQLTVGCCQHLIWKVAPGAVAVAWDVITTAIAPASATIAITGCAQKTIDEGLCLF